MIQLNNPQYENFNNWQLRATGCHFMMCNDQYPDTKCLNEGVCVEVVKSITVQIKQDHTDHSTHARSIRNFRYLKRLFLFSILFERPDSGLKRETIRTNMSKEH